MWIRERGGLEYSRAQQSYRDSNEKVGTVGNEQS